MCCCGKRTVNGEPGYKWNQPSGPESVYPISAPELPERSALVYDEPGRCCPVVNGKPYKVDHHSHHYRLVKNDIGQLRAFVRHGGGVEEFGDSYDWTRLALLMEPMDSDARFVFFMGIESTATHAARAARESEAHKWRAAAADKRIRTRRYPKRGHTKVWIEDGPRIYDVEAA